MLRKRGFEEHDVHFLVQLLLPQVQQEAESPQQQLCWRVPLHLRNRLWTQLLTAGSSDAAEITDVLLLNNSQTKQRVLAKFEEQHFIHTYLRGPSLQAILAQQPAAGSRGGGNGSGPGGALVFELPRYQLEFELRGSTLCSCNYSSYVLAPAQQLVKPCPSTPGGVEYTLPEFRQYLVLRQEAGKRLEVGLEKPEQLVLVPVGAVQLSRSGAVASGAAVWVEVSALAGAEHKVRGVQQHG